MNPKIIPILVVVSSLIVSSLCYNTNPYGPKTRRRLVDKWAMSLIQYFEIDKLLVAETMMNQRSVNSSIPPSARITTDKCNSTDEITDYFFKVYGEYDKNRLFIPSANLNEMIKHQVLGYPKSRLLQYRTEESICKRKTCFKYDTILPMIDTKYIDQETFMKICPVLLFNTELNGCEYVEDSSVLQTWQKWVYGLLLSGVVTIWSWGGAIVFPIIQKKIYKRMLTFMISLAFGCLTCNSLLKYIPLADGFDIANLENTNRTYFLKHLVILAVLFFFFNFERFMKIYAIWRTQKFKEKRRLKELANGNGAPKQSFSTMPSNDDNPHFSLGDDDNDEEQGAVPYNRTNSRPAKMDKMRNKDTRKNAMKKRMSMDLGHVNLIGVQEIGQISDQFAEVMKQDGDEDENQLIVSKSGRICCTSLTEGISEVRPIGWMAIFGDGLGNFIDGLSIGASISQNIVLGLTTALATWCGNIPQELGDFALLVRSGMTPFQALFYNYLSANSVYLGCAIGIFFGSDLESARWIFAISGATSLYLGLAVLLPEMKDEFDSNKDPIPEKLKITYIQLLGMLTGITFITILNMYEDDFETSNIAD